MHIRGVSVQECNVAVLIVVDHGTHLMVIKDRWSPNVPYQTDAHGLLSRLRERPDGTYAITKRVLFVPLQDVIE